MPDVFDFGSLDDPVPSDDVMGDDPIDDTLPDPVTDPEPDPITVSDGPTCDVCGASIPWSGRGRKPKKCADHKTRTSPNATKNRKSRTSGMAQVEADLTREMALFGKGVAKVLPTFGVTMFARAEKTSRALCRIAEGHPKLLEVLMIGTQIAPALDLGETGAELALAFLVDTGRVHPDALLPSMFGVSKTWHEINDDETATREAYIRQEQETSSPQSVFNVEVPPRFSVIT